MEFSMIMMCVFQCCAYLCHTQEETPSKQPAITTNYTHERHDSAPTEHEDSHPVRRPHLFEDDIAGHFEKCIWNEEYRHCCVVLQCIGWHVQVFRHARNLRISD
jgi:hypothetical protein